MFLLGSLRVRLGRALVREIEIVWEAEVVEARGAAEGASAGRLAGAAGRVEASGASSRREAAPEVQVLRELGVALRDVAQLGLEVALAVELAVVERETGLQPEQLAFSLDNSI